ncbi:MAG: hypothetical protein H8E48_04255 [Chloroflexi bacterium]|nr:hypothetical protein [Chloroflexota bacterium]
MNASSTGIEQVDLTPWAVLFDVDTATPITCVHLGIEYCGVVIRATRWTSDLGGPPTAGYHFKIILLQDRPKLGLPTSSHTNTAVCVPAANSGRNAQRIIGEITAAKQAEYLTRRDVDAAAINNALRDRQDSLQSELIAQESERFAKGDICVLGDSGPKPLEIYSGGDPAEWMENLAGWLLAGSYPSLPVATDDLEVPLCEDDISGLFAAIFDQPDADPDLLSAFGPSLGLTSRQSSGKYDPSGCQMFSVIREFVGGGPVTFNDLHHHLACELGLTDQLASLYVLLFIHHESAAHQLQLTDDARLLMVDGSPLQSTRLTSDLIPLLAWNNQLAAAVVTIGPAAAPRLSDARHHLSVLYPDIISSSDTEVEEGLAQSIRSLGEMIVTVRRVMDYLGKDPTDDTSAIEAALEHLSRIPNGNYLEIYSAIRANYPVLTNLVDDLGTVRRLALLNDDAPDISEARRYIASAQIPEKDFPNLAVDQETLLTELSPMRLTRLGGPGWNAITRNVTAFKVRYSQAYREHHQEFHDRLPQFQSTLTTAKKKAAALGLLNTIPELGEPTGVNLEFQLSELEVGPNPCSYLGDEIDLSNEPVCSKCQISLAQTVSSVELARLAPQVELALGGKTQELSKLLVEKTLTGNTNERWPEFLQIVQASELSSLANTLDNDLVTFIKQVLD